ncbi:hypothetical protein niasHT_035723 [Heterodera trifolii]|uniref:DNA-directed DNA polymerase n=1 Tax=Heterodera trifolii TaxID=157864 RepID=A0ABD2IL96_9BILA
MSSDDEIPPVHDGPFTPVRDSNEPFEDVPPLVEIQEDVKAKQESKIKGLLDPEQFHGDHYTCLDAAHAESGRFRAYRFLGRFVLDYIWNSDYPENVLKSIFMMCLTYAMNGAEAMNIAANHFIFLLTARHLDYEIAVHFKNVKKMDSSMAETILTRFEIVDQSNKSKERPSICEESFVIDVTAIESGLQRKKLAGKGRTTNYEVPYNISNGSTYNLANNDNFCLFRAFQWIRMKYILQRQRFSEYKRNERRQLNDITALCQACGINMNLPFYTIEEYGEKIQAYYDQHHPGMFRLFCFGTFGKMKPLWKSEVTVYQQELCVLFTEGESGQAGHFNPIKSIGRLFGTKTNYCFGCEIPYTHQTRHNGNCKWKCRNCQRVGKTFRGTCKDSGCCASCIGCGKTFESRECFEHHAKVIKVTIKKGDKEVKIEKSVCKSSKKCVDCGVIYRAMLQDKERGHVCGHKFCRVCLGFHAPRECYIPYRPKKKTEKRIIFFDFECTTDFQPDPEIARFKHQVNFCYAHVTCTCCIEKGIWNQALQQKCGICGDYRTYAWAPFDFYNTEVERRFRVDDPLAAFTKWLLQFETETLGLDSNERGKKRKCPTRGRNNVAGFFDDEAYDDEGSDDNDAENNYMLGFDEGGEKPRSVKTYAYAHAGSRYDHVLIFGEMLRMGVRPDLVRQGNHLLEMKAHKKGAITTTIFRDSYKLIPLKLASFVKTFGLNINGVENKKYFPHKFNKAANYGNVLDTLPPLEDYSPGSHFPEERMKLEKWHADNINTRFDLREIIADYCKTDVQILVHGVLKMRELFMAETMHDLTDSITIPSACMKYFVALSHQDNERIAIVPHLGYEKRGKQSTIARKYLKWRAEEEMRDNGWTLRFIESPGGEYKYGNYSLDGMMERPGMAKNLAIEVQGCYWHACPNCFPDEEAIVGGGETAGAIRARDAKRIKQIARDFEVEIIWECHLMRMLEEDPAMKAFFDNTPDTGPIEFRDAFFGGRTGPDCLAMGIMKPNGEKLNRSIKIKDFNSLYPSRNMFTKYPTGHPILLKMDNDVEWTKPEHMVDNDGIPIEGIIKCFVVPPRHCLFDIPVIPVRMNNRTLFMLCRRCSEMYPKGLVDPDYNCPHFEDHERGFSTTITHIELEAALRVGYRVTRVFSAYVWRHACDWSDSLFHSYLFKFLKIKEEASGYPTKCLEDGITEEERKKRQQQHIDNCYAKSKVRLEAARIKPNPGLRYIAKLCLNSLWGRFALRNRLTKTEIVDNDADLGKLLNDDKTEISSLDQLTDQFWMVCYKTKDEHVVEHDTSNIVIALWTTSAARLHLLESMQQVYCTEDHVQRHDTQLAYTDTDSIFYAHCNDLSDPLPGGPQLGELTDEYPNDTIIEFICAGPKAYSLCLRDNVTGELKYKMKCRGITLDSNACARISHEKMKKMVLDNWGAADNNIVFDYETNFRITKNGEIFTVPIKKQFNPTVNKGVIRNHGLLVVPFGYSTGDYCKAHNPHDCRCKHQ